MIWTVAIAVFFGAWAMLSALNQFGHGRLIRPVKQRDLFSLIPIWTFFAPRPGITDFNLVYRDRSPDEPTRAGASWSHSHRYASGRSGIRASGYGRG